MSNYYNLDGIKTMLTREIRKEETRLAAWKAVTFPTKKDGKPFAILGKNISGARLFTRSYAMQPGENALAITAWGKEVGYVSDEIDAHCLVKYIKDDAMKAKTQNYQPKLTYLEQVYTYDLDDIKTAIAARIDHLESRINALKKQVDSADDIFTTFRDAYKNAMETLDKMTADDDDKTLYYAIRDTVKDRYPYI